MGYETIMTGGRVVLGGAVVATDIALSHGRIAAIGTGLTGAERIDASGLIVTPGGVDPHCHIEQMSGMGLFNADTFETATRSAAMSGTTSMISFAAQAKGQRLADAMADYAARAARGAAIDHAFHILISDPDVPEFEGDLRALIKAGHLQIVSSDHAPYRNDETGKFANGWDAPFPAIANGMPGLEPRQPLMFDAMIKRGRLGLGGLCAPDKRGARCALRPARQGAHRARLRRRSGAVGPRAEPHLWRERPA